MKHFKKLLAALALGILALYLLALAGCAPRRAVCERNYGPCGQPSVERTIERLDTTIILPGATVHDTINYHYERRDTVFMADATGRAMLTYWRNRAGQLEARCEALPDTVHVFSERVIERETAPLPVKQPSRWPWVVAAALAALLLGLFGPRLLRLLPVLAMCVALTACSADDVKPCDAQAISALERQEQALLERRQSLVNTLAQSPPNRTQVIDLLRQVNDDLARVQAELEAELEGC